MKEQFLKRRLTLTQYDQAPHLRPSSCQQLKKRWVSENHRREQVSDYAAIEPSLTVTWESAAYDGRACSRARTGPRKIEYQAGTQIIAEDVDGGAGLSARSASD